MNHSAWRTPFALALSLERSRAGWGGAGQRDQLDRFQVGFSNTRPGKSFTFDDLLASNPEARQVAQGILPIFESPGGPEARRAMPLERCNQHRMKPKLAAFPKCYLDELCVHRTMTPRDWIEIGATLGVDGLEFFSGFIEDNEAFLRETKALLERHGLEMPMMCCSPDFTEPDPELLEAQIVMERRM